MGELDVDGKEREIARCERLDGPGRSSGLFLPSTEFLDGLLDLHMEVEQLVAPVSLHDVCPSDEGALLCGAPEVVPDVELHELEFFIECVCAK